MTPNPSPPDVPPAAPSGHAPSPAAAALNLLAAAAHCTAVAKGWYEADRSPLELLCLVHSELSECCEALCSGDPPSAKVPGHSQAVEELADAIIRILDMAAHLDLDIGAAVVAKMRFNESRPHRHGGKAY